MKTKTIVENTENRKKEVIDKLINIAKEFPYNARMEWCLKNDVSLVTLGRYLKGNCSLIVAEKLLADIETFLKHCP